MSWRNQAGWDRALRAVAGLLLVVFGLSDSGGGLPATVLTIFGWLPLVTGLTGWCPFYSLFGIRTDRG